VNVRHLAAYTGGLQGQVAGWPIQLALTDFHLDDPSELSHMALPWIIAL